MQSPNGKRPYSHINRNKKGSTKSGIFIGEKQFDINTTMWEFKLNNIRLCVKPLRLEIEATFVGTETIHGFHQP
jgi:hypothetical protein